MNFFRSEEHLRNWKDFQESKKAGIISLNDAMQLFSVPFFTKRREPEYFSYAAKYAVHMIATMEILENAGAFWRLKWFERIVFSLVLKLKLE